ncbi:aminoglycoside phosphotransferase [Nocardiopsis sp. CC223A]|uniref:aminoglycoside phosphotransferase n=1 Tax=Nocardiopsis sp. CC223A TaxID=3044051 RepID=UPI00278C572E|nr:aminoglycoside phosphotransferase [Nocardiopsis sp. CC223A]
MTTALELADQRHRDHMRTLLAQAVERFGLDPVGEAVFGWRDRTIGAAARGPHGDLWVRVTTEFPRWAHGRVWTGNADASALSGVPRPEVVEVAEWDDPPRRVRAEAATLLPGHVCSPTPFLHRRPEVGDGWWADLLGALDRLAEQDTTRVAVDQDTVTRRLSVFFGDAVDPTVNHWRTAHADLHWNNLLGPEPGILDWELWGRAPAGLDAATLYCHSLTHPETAEQVYRVFADQLDTPDGVRAQLFVIARSLLRIERGDDLAVAPLLHQRARELLGRTTAHPG